MKQRNKIYGAEGGDPEATLITPLFDEQATILARPVVPITGDAHRDAGSSYDTVATSGGKRRRSWPLALVVVSALIGSVVGVVALSFYQKRQQRARAAAVAPTAETPISSSALPQPSPNFVPTDARETAVLPDPLLNSQNPEEIKEAPIPSVKPTPGGERGADKKKSEDGKRYETLPEARASSAAGGREEQAKRRDRRGDQDEQREQRRQQRPRRVETADQQSSQEPRRNDAPAIEGDEPGPRRVDRVRDVLGGRRTRRERRAADGTQPRDSVRSIFEGQPPQF